MKSVKIKKEKGRIIQSDVRFQGTDLPDRMLFRPDEVANIFGVSKKTIYLWIQTGRLVACKPNGGAVRILRKSILSAVESSLLI